MVGIYQTMISADQQGAVDKLPIVQYLYGNALGLVELLSVGVTFITLTIVIFYRRRTMSLVLAIVILIVVATSSQLWFAGLDQFQAFGSNLSKAIIDLFKGQGVTNTGLPVIGDITTVMIALFVFGFTSIMGLNLVMMFTTYTIIGVGLKFFGLLTLSLLALGKRTQKVFNMIVAIGIVIFVLGKVAAVFIIACGQAFGQAFGPILGDPLFTQGVITIDSMAAALLIQPVLIFLMYKSVAAVAGKVRSLVKGTVNAFVQDRSRTTVKQVTNVQAAGLQARTPAGGVVTVAPRLSHSAVVKQQARNSLLKAGAGALMAKSVAATNPALALALKGAAYATQAGIKGPVPQKIDPPKPKSPAPSHP